MTTAAARGRLTGDATDQVERRRTPHAEPAATASTAPAADDGSCATLDATTPRRDEPDLGELEVRAGRLARPAAPARAGPTARRGADRRGAEAAPRRATAPGPPTVTGAAPVAPSAGRPADGTVDAARGAAS